MHSSSFSPGSSTSSGSTRIARGGWAGERGRGSRRVASRTLGCDARPPVARSRRRPETFSPWNKRASRDRPDGTRVSRAESALPALFPQAPSLSTVIPSRASARAPSPPPPPPPARSRDVAPPRRARGASPRAPPRVASARALVRVLVARTPRARFRDRSPRRWSPRRPPPRVRPDAPRVELDGPRRPRRVRGRGTGGRARALVRRDRAAAPARVRERQERRSPRRTAQDRARVRAGSRRPRRRRSRRRARARGGAARARPRRGAQDPRLRRRRHRCVGSTGPGGPGGGTRDAGTRGSPASTPPPPRLETRGPERFRSPRHASRFFREPSGDPFPEIPFANNSQKLSKTLLVRRLTTPPPSS